MSKNDLLDEVTDDILNMKTRNDYVVLSVKYGWNKYAIMIGEMINELTPRQKQQVKLMHREHELMAISKVTRNKAVLIRISEANKLLEQVTIFDNKVNRQFGIVSYERFKDKDD